MLNITPTAIIFDCDGTLADTMPSHFEAWLVTMKRYGVDFSEDEFYSMGGWPTWKVAQFLLSRRGTVEEGVIDRIVVEKEDLFRETMHLIQPILPVVDVARRHHGQVPMAVASGGLRTIVDATLAQLQISHLFQAVVTCEDVTRHKPEPDIFLEAARRLGVEPERCVVYEDTDPGVQAGRAAGMHVIDVRTFYTPRRVTQFA